MAEKSKKGGDWKSKYLENPLVQLAIICLGVYGGYVVLTNFYNAIPVYADKPDSIVFVVKIIAMLVVIALVGVGMLLLQKGVEK